MIDPSASRIDPTSNTPFTDLEKRVATIDPLALLRGVTFNQRELAVELEVAYAAALSALGQVTREHRMTTRAQSLKTVLSGEVPSGWRVHVEVVA